MIGRRYRDLLLSAFILCVGLIGAIDSNAAAPPVRVTILQVNDVYELGAVGGGAEGGLARLATLRKQLLRENPNTLTVLAGDLVSPSALGTSVIDGAKLAGRQMVDVMNLLGLDYATFGNHEFDLKVDDFRDRLEESRFQWISSNVRTASGRRWPGVSNAAVSEFSDPLSGGTTRVGFIGVTLQENRPDYVRITDPIEAVRRAVNRMRDDTDILIAVTHLKLEADIELAERVPELDLIVGGHEHENISMRRGRNYTPIYKADSNAKTAYVHRLAYRPETGEVVVRSELIRIDARFDDDPEVSERIRYWEERGFAGFRSSGFEPRKIVTTTTESLDGREKSIRDEATGLTRLIAEGMLDAAVGSETAMFNSGSIRIDDELPAGPLTEYDVLRIHPFGGVVLTVRMTGELLSEVLDQGEKNLGSGGYLHLANAVRGERGEWRIDGSALNRDRIYTVGINDYLLTGKETGLAFLNRDHPEIEVVRSGTDVRRSLMDRLIKVFGPPGE